MSIKEFKDYLTTLVISSEDMSRAIFTTLILDCNRLLMTGHDENEIYIKAANN